MSNSNSSIATIKTRIDKRDLMPYDSSSSADFFYILQHSSELMQSLDNELAKNPDWVEKAANSQIFFIVNNDAWKRPIGLHFSPELRLSLISPKKIPTISIDL